jgi:GAF domain-containing protein
VAPFSDTFDFKTQEQKLERLSHFDALTNMPNRLLMADRLKLAMAQAGRTWQRLALVYIDLDGGNPRSYLRCGFHFNVRMSRLAVTLESLQVMPAQSFLTPSSMAETHAP